MNIQDYSYKNNQALKISKTSITVKNRDTGKTVGVIRGIKTHESMKNSRILRDLFDLHDGLKKLFANSGYDDIQIRRIASKCIVIDKKIYYMYNINSYLYYLKNKDYIDKCTNMYDYKGEYDKIKKIKEYIDVIEYIPC